MRKGATHSKQLHDDKGERNCSSPGRVLLLWLIREKKWDKKCEVIVFFNLDYSILNSFSSKFKRRKGEGESFILSYSVERGFKTSSISVCGTFHNPPFLTSSFYFSKITLWVLPWLPAAPYLHSLRSSSSKLLFSHRTFHMLGEKSLENPTDGLIPPSPPCSM